MRTYCIMLMVCLGTVSLHAQSTIEKSFNASNLNELKGDFTWADVEITGWNEERVEVLASISINNGENDDAFQLEVDQSGNTLRLKTDIEGMDDLPKMITVIEDGQKYYFKRKGDYKKQIEQLKKDLGVDDFQTYSTGVMQEVKLTIKVPARMALQLESTYGDIVLKNCSNAMNVQNTYGSVEAIFPKSGTFNDATLVSTYSFVDVSIPANAGIDVVLNTSYGSIFTDLDIDIDRAASEEKAFYNKVVGRVNGGGTEVKMKAKYSNVYLRKI